MPAAMPLLDALALIAMIKRRLQIFSLLILLLPPLLRRLLFCEPSAFPLLARLGSDPKDPALLDIMTFPAARWYLAVLPQPAISPPLSFSIFTASGLLLHPDAVYSLLGALRLPQPVV